MTLGRSLRRTSIWMAQNVCRLCQRQARAVRNLALSDSVCELVSSHLARSARRSVSTTQQFRGPHGNVKVDMTSSHLIGVAQSRGERSHQEDRYSACSISIPARDLRLNLRDSEHRDAAAPSNTEPSNNQDAQEAVAFVACYDGHGGDAVSELLVDRLPELVEAATPKDVPKLLEDYRSIGGYMRRFKNTYLDRHADKDSGIEMSLDERATLAFLQADHQVVVDDNIGNVGSTATAAFLHSIDSPPTAFFSASQLSLTIAHVGDTKALLASQRSGRVQALTEAHHPDSRVESERLRRIGTGLVTDSFGESRWGGALANTRAIGDKRFKRLGVSGEPDIIKRVLEGHEWAFLALISDGISSVISDQEVIDLCRGHQDPTKAAEAVVSFTEGIGGEDNMTCVIVPLPGWRKLGGSDTTAARREYRQRQTSAEHRSRRQ